VHFNLRIYLFLFFYRRCLVYIVLIVTCNSADPPHAMQPFIGARHGDVLVFQLYSTLYSVLYEYTGHDTTRSHARVAATQLAAARDL
jgi:hypothetical protein